MDKKAMIESLAREAGEKGLFTGTWLYAENGLIVSKGAVGWRDPGNQLPVREDSLFDLASVSKHFTATAVMLLRKRGLLSLEDEITKFFPEIPYKGVTIRHLLNHTGGLPDYMEWVEKTAKEENTIPGNDIMVRFLCENGEEPSFAPGEKFEYSNTGYCLLAQIVEKASGVFFDDFMKKNIFEPAGMSATRLIHRRKDHLTVENLAYGMVLDKNGRYILPDDAEGSDHCVVPLDGVSGDGIVHTNIFDLLTWDRVQREEKLLSKEEQEMMYTPGKLNNGEDAGQDDEEGAVGYGFGWDIFSDPEYGRIIAHSGGWPGYNTWYQRFLDADRVMVILCCRDSLDDRGHDSFMDGMKAIVKDREPGPIRTVEDLAIKDPDRSGWEELCGTYEWQKYRITVSVKGENLFADFVQDTGDSLEMKLYPLGGKTFGMKEESGDITFGDGCLTFYDVEGRKL